MTPKIVYDATIGALSRRTGISIKTIRYYSEIGLVPESGRTRAGYRRYDSSALLRLELVRTLRELGFDLTTIRTVLDRRADLGAVAKAQVEAIDTQIKVLRLRRAVLRRLADNDPTDREVERMHRLAHASAEERRTIMHEFLDHTFRDLDVDPAFEAKFRAGMPELPEDPTDAQVDAWVELAELVSDPDFRASVRAMSEAAWGADGGREQMADQETNARMMAYADERVVPLMDAGIDPASPEAAALVDEIVTSLGEPDRRGLLARWEVGADARAERYWQLIGTINGWPPFPARMPVFEWLIAALRATIGISRR